ncbi:MAG: hypothetical protein JWN73_1353 [Betaproteobacteria bacterium]|nr:hypothetical protein [Betaproteobacteria bacterium]
MKQIDAPSLIALSEARHGLAAQGFAFVPGAAASAALGLQPQAGADFVESWDRLSLDTYLADGGKYRMRRHASLLQAFEPPALTEVAYRPHWQPKSYNHLHGGVFRTFEPVEPEIAAHPAYRNLITGLGRLFASLMPVPRWYVEAHQFRIDASTGEARPTPEGAHRDGVDYVALVLIRRGTVDGGVTSIFDADRKLIATEQLNEPWSLMLLDDVRVTHATTPITAAGVMPIRDTLVLTYRRDGFLEPAQA